MEATRRGIRDWGEGGEEEEEEVGIVGERWEGGGDEYGREVG